MNIPHPLRRDAQGICHISGVPSLSAKTFLLTNRDTPFQMNERVLWLTQTAAEAEQVAYFLKIWQEKTKRAQPVLLFHDHQLSACLWWFLTAQPGWLIIPVEAFLGTVPTPDDYAKKIRHLSVTEQLSPAKLSYELVVRGYEFNTTADAIGTFARRGNIVDIFPPNSAHPFRCEFGPAAIDQLTRFDSVTGRNLEKLAELELLPARLELADAQGSLFDYLAPAAKTPFRVVYSDPDELEKASPDWSKIGQWVAQSPQYVFHALPTGQAENTFDFKPTPLFHGRLTEFLAALSDWQRNKYSIYIPATLKDGLERLWQKEKPDATPLSLTELDLDPTIRPESGFVSRERRSVLLTEFELFGAARRETDSSARPKKISRKTRREIISFIAELEPGDYVVHLDHGVGRFRGMTTHVVDGIAREYLELEYAERDKLSVPVELAYKIDKYVGSERPAVHRLSNTTWRQVTQKIKEEAKQIADELIKLYANRRLAVVEPCEPATPAEIELAKSFPYQETADQAKAIHDVVSDLEKTEPMDRLICGDVGFGKTEIAIRAALKMAMNKKQVAILAPTTILVQQHYDTFHSRLSRFPVKIEALSRFKTTAQQKEAVAKLKTGEVDIIIGTHRLLSADVHFKNLGLIIIDEEQRFGVKHKEKLKALRVDSHVLTLTATPIPRTLNLGLSTLRDMSVIRTAPEGRQPIETIIRPHADEIIKEAVDFELQRGGQVYFLYNKVETINLKANQLQRLIPNATIGVVHGQLPDAQLAQTMSDFDNQKLNILVSTTIIENGLDLPNVNTLIVEDATRFGLPQLNLWRGRSGRGHRQAFAYFLYPQKKLTGVAKKRLQAILDAKELGSGFQLALRDLEIRGVGNLLGREQHGRVNAIGLSLYSRLLSQAVEELRSGKPAKELRDISIDLPLPITIPPDYIEQENRRLQVYRDLSDSVDADELDERFVKLTQSYGPPPPNVENLRRLLALKLACQDTDVATIDTIDLALEQGVTKRRLIIEFKNLYTPDQIKNLLAKNPDWVLGENQIRIDFDKLGQDWLAEIERVIRCFVNNV